MIRLFIPFYQLNQRQIKKKILGDRKHHLIKGLFLLLEFNTLHCKAEYYEQTQIHGRNEKRREKKSHW